MNRMTIPSPYCPFPGAINPHVEQAQAHTLQWALRFNLISADGPQYQRFRRAKFAWLAALTHPHTPSMDLELITDWHTWLFSHDDICDATQVGWDPDRVAAMDWYLLNAFKDHVELSSAEPLACALEDIYQRLQQRASALWVKRFAYDVQRYFQGNRWEATNRHHDLTPDLATYVKMRLHTGAVFSCFDLIGITENIDSESEFLAHVYVQELMVMANHHICWINDIFGLEKEIREGNMNNLVLVLQHQDQSSLQVAIDQAMAMCNAEMKAFLGLEARLLTCEGLETEQANRFLGGLRSWMRGHINWYTETGRYQPKK